MKNIHSLLLLSAACCTAIGLSARTVEIIGSDVMTVTPAASTGLNQIFIVRNTADATIQFRTNSQRIDWQRYSTLGGGYAESVGRVSHSGDTFFISAAAGDMGYIINDGTNSIAFWVIDYSAHEWDVSAISVDESDCDRVRLHVDGTAPELPFYTVNGRRDVVSRDIELHYTTLRYDSDSHSYVSESAVEHYASAVGSLYASAPLCDTRFTLVPDRYAAAWQRVSDVESPSFTATAVQAATTATKVDSGIDADNEIRNDSEGLGGSAPCEVAFSAAVTDAAIFRRWEVASTPDFMDVSISSSELDFDYTFTEAGTTYVRFIANNAAGTCEYIGDTYTVSIGESRLECPNAFSPGTADGVNDEWKVSYQSIVSFDCQIFNRWGKKLATLTHPSQGWDGMVGGKPVSSGVYFYVINALGADGKAYKLSGDINVINSRRNSSTNNSVE